MDVRPGACRIAGCAIPTGSAGHAPAGAEVGTEFNPDQSVGPVKRLCCPFDAEAANVAARRWLREAANACVPGTTGEVPADRLTLERPVLQSIPAPYGGGRPTPAAKPAVPIAGLQHPLSFYDAFAGVTA